MPLAMKIQPIDSSTPECYDLVKVMPKSRLRRLFDFSSFLRSSAVADRSGAGELHCGRDGSDEFEPSSVCLDKMVQNFIEESNEKQPEKSIDSDDEFESVNCFGNSNSNNHSSSTEISDPLKSLVICETVSEWNLLADVTKMVDKNNICKKKKEISSKIVVDGLLASGYSVSICKSRWDKTSTYPAGEYEYIDAIIEEERFIIDIDFRSEFEIARSTKTYKAILQTLPQIFVGKPDRLQKIITLVSDAAKQSLKKKGMPLPPWRRAEYFKAKWLSPCSQTNETRSDTNDKSLNAMKLDVVLDPKDAILINEVIKPKLPKTGGKIVSGLASVIEGK